MEEKPKSVQEPILNRLGLLLIGVISTVSAAVALAVFGHYWLQHNEIMEARGLAFGVFAANSMIYIFAYRSLRRPLFQMPSLSTNKPLVVAVVGGLALAVAALMLPPIQRLLGVTFLHPYQWPLVFGMGTGMLVVVELAKLAFNRRGLHLPHVAERT